MWPPARARQSLRQNHPTKRPRLHHRTNSETPWHSVLIILERKWDRPGGTSSDDSMIGLNKTHLNTEWKVLAHGSPKKLRNIWAGRRWVRRRRVNLGCLSAGRRRTWSARHDLCGGQSRRCLSRRCPPVERRLELHHVQAEVLQAAPYTRNRVAVAVVYVDVQKRLVHA